MKSHKYLKTVSLLLAGSLLLCACQAKPEDTVSGQSQADPGVNTEAKSQDENTGKKTEDENTGETAENEKEANVGITGNGGADTDADAAGSIRLQALANLDLDSSLLTERFYGNGMQTCLNFTGNSIYYEDAELSCFFSGWEEETQYFDIYMASADFMTEEGKKSYILSPDISDEYTQLPAEDWQLSFIEHGPSFFVRVSGAGELDGDYFTLEQMTAEPGLFERYLSRADLYRYTKEELRILRNGVYAIHGAVFSSEDLKSYFGEKIWYKGSIPTAKFPDQKLSDIEQANLALIKELEAADVLTTDGTDYRTAYEQRTEAAYLSVLDQFTETGIHVDMRQAADMGYYYSVPGEILVPVTLTPDQIAAIQHGEELELSVSGMAGESMILCKNPDSESGDYSFWMYEKGENPEEYGIDVNVFLNLDSGLYTMWIMSDDTVMTTAYEGDIFILKGAVRGNEVSLQGASAVQRELKIPESEEDYWNKEVWSNRVFHDQKGYITAVYYLGD